MRNRVFMCISCCCLSTALATIKRIRFYRLEENRCAQSDLSEGVGDHLRRNELYLRYALKCSEKASCVAVNAFINGTCELVLTWSYEGHAGDGCSLIIEEHFCPEGFGNAFAPETGFGVASCYQIEEESREWQAARGYCRSINADLASVKMPGEASHVMFVFDGKEEKGIWVSGSDDETEGTWKWAATGDDVAFDGWKIGEPNDRNGGEDCMELSVLGWNDAPCGTKHKALCETNAVYNG